MARYWAVVAGLLAYCWQAVDGQGMSVSIDWSSSTEDGVATPHVHVPDAVGAAPGTDAILGYYANSDGFYGRVDFTEYVRVHIDEAGRLAALKIVGDANVPRGQATFRTTDWRASMEPRWRMGIQLHLRDDPSDEGAYTWGPTGFHDILWAAPDDDGTVSSFSVEGVSPRGYGGHFRRVSEEEALRAALSTEDAE